MKSASAAGRRSAAANSLRRTARQPKLAGELESEGWTTEMFVDAVDRGLSQ
jgi:hypothetical protein